MPDAEELGETDRDQLPLCTYLTFPFGVPNNPPKDILLDGPLTHRFPRIFDIGVLLLEIGLGKPFRRSEKSNEDARVNFNHRIAVKEHQKLADEAWDGFLNKKAFDQAVGFCLNNDNFLTDAEKPKTNHLGVVKPAKPSTKSDPKKGILARRRIFYKNVVKPLAWLAKEGFRSQTGKVSYISRKPEAPKPAASPPGLPQALEQPGWEDVFHSTIIPKNWPEDLKKISALVAAKRRQHQIRTPVRVAILDTGLNKNMAIFKEKPQLLKCVTDEIDYVDPGCDMTDAFGHGTLMARLVMECAPGAEILVARVARDTETLCTSKGNIRDVSRTMARSDELSTRH